MGGDKTMILGGGNSLINALEGADVVFASRFLEKIPEGLRWMPLTFENLELLQEAFRDVEVLVLILPVEEAMLRYVHNIISAARTAGVQFVLQVSVLGASSLSTYLYQRVQGESENILIQSGIPYCILRPNIFMQCYLNNYMESLMVGALYLPEGEGRVSFVDARDVAGAIQQLLKDPFRYRNKTFELTGGRALSNAEAISIISYYTGRRLAYVPVTDEFALAALQKKELSSWMCDAILSQHRANRDGENAKVTSTLKLLLGRDPRSFESFCQDNREAWQVPPPSPEP